MLGKVLGIQNFAQAVKYIVAYIWLISLFSSPTYDAILCQLHETDGESFLRENGDEGDQ